MLKNKFSAAALTFALCASVAPVALANLSPSTEVAVLATDKDNEAQQEANISSPVLPASIARALDQGMQLESQFTAESGLTGWVLSRDGEYTLVYTTPDQRSLISGALINDAGQNLTEQYAREYFPKPDIALLDGATYISEGKADDQSLPDSATSEASDESSEGVGDMTAEQSTEAAVSPVPTRTLYVFFDPDSPFCQSIWKALRPYAGQGTEFRWVPVAFLTPQSREKAAAVLQSSQPGKALASSMQHFGEAEQPTASVKDTSRRQLQNNMKLMQRFGIQGTPGIVWVDETGVLQVRSGMPRLSELPLITGLPEQPQTDPELYRFR